MRSEVVELVKLGPFPAEEVATEEDVELRDALTRRLSRPLTEEEARALITLFGNDSLFGIAWALLHEIEAADGWPYWDELRDLSNPWRERLALRLANAGYVPPT